MMTRRRRNSHPKLFLACLLAIGTAVVSPRGKAHSSTATTVAASQPSTQGRAPLPASQRVARPAIARR